MLRSPRFWIAAQLVAIAAAGWLLGYGPVQTGPDSESYIASSKLDWAPMLAEPRTIGYPLMLRAIAAFSPDYRAVPWIQLALLCPAVFLFDAALRRFGAMPWQAFAGSSGFMYGAIQLPWLVSIVLTDFPAAVAAGMAVACVFWLAARPRNVLCWLGLTLFLAAAYHLRPAYLFLIPLAPCLGLVLRRIHAKATGTPTRWRGFLAALLAVSLLPLLAFCTLRWMTVGDFGLVSFGGFNSVGLAAELLDKPLVEHELSPDFRPLARAILEGRETRHLRPAYPGGWRMDMSAYEHNYCINIYNIVRPVARQLYGDDPVAFNRAVERFSREVFRLRKGKCALWAVQYWPRAALKLAYRCWFLQLAVPLAGLLFVIRVGRSGRRPSPALAAAAAVDKPLILSLIWLNILYFGAATSVLILSGTYADSRLVVPTGIYLPSLVGLLILRELRLLTAVAGGRQQPHACQAPAGAIK